MTLNQVKTLYRAFNYVGLLAGFLLCLLFWELPTRWDFIRANALLLLVLIGQEARQALKEIPMNGNRFNSRSGHKGKIVRFVPITPAGSPCIWLASDTEEDAWKALLKDASRMPYKDKEGFEEVGYTVARWEF